MILFVVFVLEPKVDSGLRKRKQDSKSEEESKVGVK